jgi:hypothetical protein
MKFEEFETGDRLEVCFRLTRARGPRQIRLVAQGDNDTGLQWPRLNEADRTRERAAKTAVFE